MQKYKYCVVSRYGFVIKFSDFSDLLEFVRTKHYGEFGNYFTEKRRQYVEPVKHSFTWSCSGREPVKVSTETELRPIIYVVYDEYDNVVPVRSYEHSIYHHYKQPNPIWRHHGNSWRVLHENYPGFRNGPVPYTGNDNWCFSNYYKTPRTTQELRWNCAHKKYTRGKRRSLPSSWSDYPRGDKYIKSWKKQKKRKQWM